jgi:hypothetical protein
MLSRAMVVASIAVGLGVPLMARAAPGPIEDLGERAEALLRTDAINRFIAKQLPATFAVRGDRDAGIGAEDVTLVDARYCAAKDASHGRIVGLLRSAAGGAEAPTASGAATPAAIEAGDCQAKLDGVARRLAGAPDAGAVAVVELLAEWVPWQLRVSIGDVAARGEGARSLARTLSRAKAAGPLVAIDTSDLRLQTERGASLGLDLALGFLKGGEGVRSTLTFACQGCAPAARAPLVNPAVAPTDVDGIVAATLSFANRIIALYGEDGPLVLELEGQTVEIRGLQVSGGEGTLALRGRATSRSFSESAQIRLEAAGPDLRLSEARAEAEGEDCSALSGGASMRCRVRNAARGPAAGALAAAMTSRYRGKLLRTLIAPPPFSFEVGGRRMTLRLTPTRASSTAGSLVVSGKADLE